MYSHSRIYLVALALFLPLTGCSTSVQSLTVFPSAGVEVLSAAGKTAQFRASETTATRGTQGTDTRDVTHSAKWISGDTSVATIDASGLATAVGVGTTKISAEDGGISGLSDVTVTAVTAATGGTGSNGGNIVSLTIIPSGIVFGSLTESGQFLAIGTFSSSPTVRDLTNSVTWLTSAPNVFPVTNYSGTVTGSGTQNGGVVSAYGASAGTVGATITAEATDSNGSIATATAGVGCPYLPANPTGNPPTAGSCNQNIPQLLSTLTVYNEGLNPNTPQAGGNWLLTAPSATCNLAVAGTCTPVITCGPAAGAGKSVCTATYPLNTTVTLTAPAQIGVKFGGWSSNCMITGTVTQAGPNTCTINLSTSDATVGAIFN